MCTGFTASSKGVFWSVGSQHSKGGLWGKCGSTKIILVEIQQLVPEEARRKGRRETAGAGVAAGGRNEWMNGRMDGFGPQIFTNAECMAADSRIRG